MQTTQYQFFATTAKGLELLLVDELRELGAVDAAEKLAGVTFTGNLELAYKACLWSRLANRILLQLHQFSAESAEELYAGIQAVNWDEHLDVDGTFAVHSVCSQSTLTHSLFIAQKVKDAIVDQFRDQYDRRPDVSKEKPQVNVYVYLYRNTAHVYLDLSGESLHRRGYRLSQGAAPLKENLAAAILLRAEWPTIAKEQGSLMDPMCGSGTLLIEAALMAGDIAPGLNRDYFGFLGWKKHQATLWQHLLNEAQSRHDVGVRYIPEIIGYDQDAEAISIAFENIERAGMRGKIHVEKRELSVFAPKSNAKPGLVVTNPPYGERLGEVEELMPLYTLLGDKLKSQFSGWKAAVFTANPDLGKQMGLRAKHYYAFFNGAIPCKLLLFDVEAMYYVDRSVEGENERRIRQAKRAMMNVDDQSAQMFVNRLRKNLKHIAKQAKRQELTSYRVYDADLPEYSFAIDVTEDSVKVQEYQAPRSIDPKKVLRRRQEVLAILPEELNMPAEKIFFNVVSRKK
ncbi:MAG: hypothetical protein ACD_46C00103G0009 [uncultured bacterium]|nr:MAG: hypothetical protein ACD_46C00103G0009 [uncultured bacterium]